MQGIYLDNSTITRPSDRAVAAMMPFLTERWGCTLAPHACGHDAFVGIASAWPAFYRLLGASEEDEIVLTGSGAEAVQAVVTSAYDTLAVQSGRNQFITAMTDEAPAILSMGKLEQRGCVVRGAAPDKEGRITAEAIADVMTPRTALVSLSWANGLTGVIHPVAAIGQLCKERGVLFHLEVSHGIGQIYGDLDEFGAQFISVASEHIHAPKGLGILRVKKGTKYERLVEGGMLPVAEAAAAAEAAKECWEQRDYVCTEVARLRDAFERGILEAIPDVHVFFQDQERIPTVSCIAFPGIINEALLYTLNKRGVYASMGGGIFQQIALILEASGVDEVVAQTALTFSLSRETTEEQIDRAVDILADSVRRLRKTTAGWGASK